MDIAVGLVSKRRLGVEWSLSRSLLPEILSAQLLLPLADHPPQHVGELLSEIGVVVVAMVGFVAKLSREHIPHQGEFHKFERVGGELRVKQEDRVGWIVKPQRRAVDENEVPRGTIRGGIETKGFGGLVLDGVGDWETLLVAPGGIEGFERAMVHAVQPAIVVDHPEDFDLVVSEGVGGGPGNHGDEAGGDKPRRATSVVHEVVVVLLGGDRVSITESEGLH